MNTKLKSAAAAALALSAALAKLKRAKGTVEGLLRRFPGNEAMARAVERLSRAIEFTERRGRRPPPSRRSFSEKLMPL